MRLATRRDGYFSRVVPALGPSPHTTTRDMREHSALGGLTSGHTAQRLTREVLQDR